LNAVMRTLRGAVRRRHCVAAVGVCAIFAALDARAADLGVVSGAFGNTIVSTYPDGRSQKIWLHPDGSWDGLSRGGLPMAGSWRLRGTKVCLRQSKPPTLPFSFCTPFPERTEPGVQWTSRDMGGTPIRLTLQKGILLQVPEPR
jgi:hypothetical protein